MKFFAILFLVVAVIATVFAENDDETLGNSPRCRQPIARGDTSCSEDLDRYGYDANKGACVRFTYTGCGGNSNRFDTLSACRASCS